MTIKELKRILFETEIADDKEIYICYTDPKSYLIVEEIYIDRDGDLIVG